MIRGIYHAHRNSACHNFVSTCWNNFKWNSASSNLDTAMTSSVKLFQFLKDFCRSVGFCPSQSGQIQFNWKNSLILLSILQLWLSTSALCLFEGDSILKYGTRIYASITTLCAFGVIAIKLWKMTDVLALIEKFDNFVARSKYMVCDSNRLRLQKQFILHSNRSKQCHFDGHVHRIECEYRTNVTVRSCVPSKNRIFGIRNVSSDLNFCQLLHLRYEKWIIPFDISGDVSPMLIVLLSSFKSEYFSSSFFSFEDAIRLENSTWLFGRIFARDISICLYCPGLCSFGVPFGRLVQLIHIVCQRHRRQLLQVG